MSQRGCSSPVTPFEVPVGASFSRRVQRVLSRISSLQSLPNLRSGRTALLIRPLGFAPLSSRPLVKKVSHQPNLQAALATVSVACFFDGTSHLHCFPVRSRKQNPSVNAAHAAFPQSFAPASNAVKASVPKRFSCPGAPTITPRSRSPRSLAPLSGRGGHRLAATSKTYNTGGLAALSL
jgi:hypothetical protein